MSWIKRNILFVASLGVGVLLMAAGGYYLYSNLDENTKLTDEFKQAVSDYTGLQSKNPYPSQENIQAANQQKEEVRNFLGEFKTGFASFPAPAAMDERTFGTYVARTITDLQKDANEAGVGITQDFSFSFSSIYSPSHEQVSYPTNCIPLWLGQMDEIKTICGILFRAKVNYLEGLRRVAICPDLEHPGAEFLQTTSITNQEGVVTPYEISFRGFSDEISAVLNGFLQASNCFIVKCINIEPSKAQLTLPPTAAAMNAPAPVYYQQPVRQRPMPPAGDRYSTAESSPFGGAVSTTTAARPVQRVIYAGQPAATGPTTILWAKPLHVTITVEILKTKTSP